LKNLFRSLPNIIKAGGDTSLKFFNRSDVSLTNSIKDASSIKSIKRPHVLSSGFSLGGDGIHEVVLGLDQSPVSSDTAIIFLNSTTGDIQETIFFPRNFFLEDIHHESDTSILLSITEGLATLSNGTTSVYQLVLPSRPKKRGRNKPRNRTRAKRKGK